MPGKETASTAKTSQAPTASSQTSASEEHEAVARAKKASEPAAPPEGHTKASGAVPKRPTLPPVPRFDAVRVIADEDVEMTPVSGGASQQGESAPTAPIPDNDAEMTDAENSSTDTR